MAPLNLLSFVHFFKFFVCSSLFVPRHGSRRSLSRHSSLLFRRWSSAGSPRVRRPRLSLSSGISTPPSAAPSVLGDINAAVRGSLKPAVRGEIAAAIRGLHKPACSSCGKPTADSSPPFAGKSAPPSAAYTSPPAVHVASRPAVHVASPPAVLVASPPLTQARRPPLTQACRLPLSTFPWIQSTCPARSAGFKSCRTHRNSFNFV